MPPQVTKGKYIMLGNERSELARWTCDVGSVVTWGSTSLPEYGFRPEHFRIFRGTTSSYLIAEFPTVSFGGVLTNCESAAFDQGVQMASCPESDKHLIIVEGDASLREAFNAAWREDHFWNSCPMCLTGGTCRRCGGTLISIHPETVRPGKYQFVERPCKSCRGTGKCQYCYEIRSVVLEARSLINEGQLVRATAMVNHALAHSQFPMTGSPGIAKTLLDVFTSVFQDFSSMDKDLITQLLASDLLFLRASIQHAAGATADALVTLTEALTRNPAHAGAAAVFKELGI